MFSKSLFAGVVALGMALQVSAHTVVKPALGIKGEPVRSDTQRPSTANPCGKINVAQNIDTSASVTAAADGSFSLTATNFNKVADGSREFITVVLDATGSGKFVAGPTMIKNGDPAPAALGSEQVTAKLPAGTKCTGGKDKNKCIVSFKTKRGFGNCVVVQQGKGQATNSVKPADAPKGKKVKASDSKAKDSKRANLVNARKDVDVDVKELIEKMRTLIGNIKAKRAADADKAAGGNKDADETGEVASKKRMSFNREY